MCFCFSEENHVIVGNSKNFNKNVQFIDASMHFRALERKYFFSNIFKQSEKTKIGFKVIIFSIHGLRKFREDHR